MVSLGGEIGAFPPGSTVSFKTIHQTGVTGQVVCFDPTLKALVIRSIDENTKKPIIRIFNLSLISEIKEVAATTGMGTIESHLSNCTLNAKKTSERIAANLKARAEEIMPSDDVDVNGQKAFLQIKRTIADTRWDGPNIRVVGLVVVTKPYNSESVEILKSNVHNESDETKAQTALNQVKKILSKPFNIEDRFRPEWVIRNT